MGIKELEAKIKEKVNQQLEKQNSEANQVLAEIAAVFNQKKNGLDKTFQTESRKEVDLLIKKELIPAKLKSKSMLLSTKRNLINQVYEEAKKQFTATSGKEYKTIIKQLLKANPLKGKVEIIPCQANEKDTKVALEEAAKSAKLEITWSDPTPTISGGFIAKQGLIDFDYSFDTYFKTIRKTLEDEIIKLLFKS